jgi:lysylphosphatidylglycerol synthetase-like protein (DUF2156 family)
MQSISRPFGITLLAILHVVQGLLLLLAGIAVIAVGEFIRRGMFRIPRLLVGGALTVIGVVLIVVALLYAVLAWGLWEGKGWAWVASLILATIGIIFSLLSLFRGSLVGLLFLILDAIIAYYLFRPNVRAFFGERKPATAGTQQVQPTPQVPAARFCANCGAPAQAMEKFCSHCGKALS